MPRVNFYSGAGLDRADHLRSDDGHLAALAADPATRFVPVWRARNLIGERDDGPEPEPHAVWITGEDAAALAARADDRIFLGLDGEAAMVALDLSSQEAPEALPGLAGLGRFRDLREVGSLLPRAEGAILAYARGLMYWHRRHRFCGRCGAPTTSRRGGHARLCSARDCAIEHFPRTDPAVIMLVHDGERCVLGRKGGWAPGMHSTLAGFVEPGESLEESVAREVLEEVGLAVDVAEVDYHSSQPWPFPASLMLGFHARAAHGPLTVDAEELDAALWVSRDELRHLDESETLRLPSRDSIARRLIEDWIKRG
jgi:NAD+ diphosphatase